MKYLYPDIPYYLGLRAHNDFLLDRNLPTNVVNGMHNMTELELKQNVFEFNYEHFLQTSDIAIGTTIAAANANIVMSILERNYINNVTGH